jgi:hypothetical protein
LSYLIYGRPGAARSNGIPVNMDKLKHEDRTITTKFSAEQVLWKNILSTFQNASHRKHKDPEYKNSWSMYFEFSIVTDPRA